MLDQRDYMRDTGRRQEARRSGGPGAVILLLIANIVIYLVDNNQFRDKMSLMVPSFHENFLHQSYRLFTYLFLHGSLGHIFFNMWGLYLFGSVLEPRIGTRRFYTLYLISGVSGGLLWLAANWTMPYLNFEIAGVPARIPNACIGASGAIFGIMIATALFYPDMRLMLIIPPIPMKLKTFAMAYAALEIFLELSKAQAGVAHLAHLGGFVGGYAYIKLVYGREVWGISSLLRKKTKHPLYNKNEYLLFPDARKVSQEDLDGLLDKISREGINSLSEEEMNSLRLAREEMNRH